jgi:hypothetical protein
MRLFRRQAIIVDGQRGGRQQNQGRLGILRETHRTGILDVDAAVRGDPGAFRRGRRAGSGPAAPVRQVAYKVIRNRAKR